MATWFSKAFPCLTVQHDCRGRRSTTRPTVHGTRYRVGSCIGCQMCAKRSGRARRWNQHRNSAPLRHPPDSAAFRTRPVRGGGKNAVGVHDATATFAAMRRPIATSTTFNLTLLPGAVVRAYPRTARAQRTTVTLLISAYCLLLVLDILLSWMKTSGLVAGLIAVFTVLPPFIKNYNNHFSRSQII
jgi:hypothetical protein